MLWHDKATGGMTATHFHELEDTKCLNRWGEALYKCKPVFIADTSIFKDTSPVEYELYNRCHANSISVTTDIVREKSGIERST